MANINITQIRMKRGNTAASSTYTGPLGELLVDTGLKTIRVQDGVTPGGMSILATNAQVWALSNSISTIAGVDTTLLANAATQQSQINTFNANLGSFQAYANSTFVAGNYSNTNVSAYLSGQNITSANIGAFQTYANLNISELQSNASTQTVDINLVNANVTSANAAITSLQSNAATQAGILDTLTANAATQSTVLDTLISNAATQASTLTTLLSNAATQQTSLTDLLANAATQADSINTLQTQVYANANVADYLPTYTGNIAGNIVKSGYTWTFSNTGTTTFPTGVRLSNARGANTVNFTTDVDKSFQIETQTNATSKLWNFTTDGNLTLPQNANINFANGVSILAGITGTYGNTQVAAYLPTYTGNIAGNIVKNGNVWTFGTNGTTTFPTNVSIDYSAGNVQFPRIIADSGKAFSIQAQGNTGSAALAWTVNPDAAGQYAQVGVTRGGGDNLAKVVLQAQSDSGDAATAKIWQFNETGTTRFPDGTILAPAGQNITMQSDQYSQLYWQNANVTVAPDMAINSNFYVAQNSATLDIVYRDGSSNQQQKSWLWSLDGGMSFPDTTTQYTAFSNAAVATYLSNYDGGINFTASPAVITGLGNISSANFTFANGVNILSTVTDLYANAAVQSANIATLFSNAATQATSINTINNTLTSSNVGIGAGAGSESQGTSAVAIGEGAGSLDQGLYSVAIGNDAGADNQGDRSVAVGTGAGRTNQGNYAVAIGRNAGYTNQGNNSIIINATTGTLNQITANTFTVAPVRNDVSNVAQVMFYNTTNKEITYGNTINIAGNINAAQYNFANGVNILSTVGAGAYGNTQVASYLLNFDGDIEFTSSTARIGNVDVITVGDHIRSPAYQFSNGTSIFTGITGTYSNTNVASYLTTATITTTGNITAGNLTATGTFTVANITTTGAYGNITGANVISANTVSATNYLFANGVNILSNVVTRFESTWTVPTGNSTQSFTVGAGETYYMWVDCNIPNGIIAWNATATVTNTNVPVVGAQYAWVYTGNGTPIDFTSIPNQFVGTANTIVRSTTAPSATTNRFDFGLNNTSGGNVTVRYGWVAIS